MKQVNPTVVDSKLAKTRKSPLSASFPISIYKSSTNILSSESFLKVFLVNLS